VRPLLTDGASLKPDESEGCSPEESCPGVGGQLLSRGPARLSVAY